MQPRRPVLESLLHILHPTAAQRIPGTFLRDLPVHPTDLPQERGGDAVESEPFEVLSIAVRRRRRRSCDAGDPCRLAEGGESRAQVPQSVGQVGAVRGFEPLDAESVSSYGRVCASRKYLTASVPNADTKSSGSRALPADLSCARAGEG
jgi:hypothetical protein